MQDIQLINLFYIHSFSHTEDYRVMKKNWQKNHKEKQNQLKNISELEHCLKFKQAMTTIWFQP